MGTHPAAPAAAPLRGWLASSPHAATGGAGAGQCVGSTCPKLPTEVARATGGEPAAMRGASNQLWGQVLLGGIGGGVVCASIAPWA